LRYETSQNGDQTSPQCDAFRNGLKRLLAVPKPQIDCPEAEWRKQQDAKKDKKPGK
jgi:hypothetical protein